MLELPSITIVVIGCNEEKNLEAAFNSISLIDYPREKLEVIYVDSNSSDRSVEIARRHADAVFIESHHLPSAARGRNRGLVEAQHEIVHFIDGDVRIAPGYLKKAIAVFENPHVHAVGGFIREETDRFWNCVMSGAWIAPLEGIVHATAAGGTYRRGPLLQINGYDERIVLGEETELGERFREAGFCIWSILDLMGIHDYGAIGWIDYVRLYVKDGKIKTRLLVLPDKSAFFDSNRHAAKNNALHNLVMILFIGVAVLLKKWLWIPVSFAFFLLVIFIKYLAVMRVKGKMKMLFYLLMSLAKPIVFAGQVKEWIKINVNPAYRKSLQIKKMILNK